MVLPAGMVDVETSSTIIAKIIRFASVRAWARWHEVVHRANILVPIGYVHPLTIYGHFMYGHTNVHATQPLILRYFLSQDYRKFACTSKSCRMKVKADILSLLIPLDLIHCGGGGRGDGLYPGQ